MRKHIKRTNRADTQNYNDIVQDKKDARKEFKKISILSIIMKRLLKNIIRVHKKLESI